MKLRPGQIFFAVHQSPHAIELQSGYNLFPGVKIIFSSASYERARERAQSMASQLQLCFLDYCLYNPDFL